MSCLAMLQFIQLFCPTATFVPSFAFLYLNRMGRCWTQRIHSAVGTQAPNAVDFIGP